MTKVRSFLLALIFVCCRYDTYAFSLLGPFAEWQTTQIGYQLGDDIGGPMNLGEEYRINLPVIIYAFDQSFLDYFGQKGVEEVEKAIAVFNSLPAFSSMSPDLHEFPLSTRRMNYRASALNLLDLKTYTIALLLEQLGVAPAERYVWTLRNYIPPEVGPIWTVIQRNFDPVTGEPSSYVNGVLYTYVIMQTYTDPEVWEAVEVPVDPVKPSLTSISSLNLGGGTVDSPYTRWINGPGWYITGLTRDDIGALRYIYRFGNYNVETLISGASPAPVGAKEFNGILDRSTSNPWGAPGGTNQITTNVLITTALRPGIDKFRFIRVDYDSLTGAWLPVTNRFVDYFITNKTIAKQIVDRVLSTGPDLLFGAADLGVNDAGQPILVQRTTQFTSLDTINGNTTLNGPGLINVPLQITFSKVGRSWINTQQGTGEAEGEIGLWWGSFDGSTNQPIVYPSGTSIRQIEELILRDKARKPKTNPWLAPPALVVQPQATTNQYGYFGGGTGQIGTGTASAGTTGTGG